jgi:hypothetical protein
VGTQAVDEVRRRVQQETLGHRGRKNDPLYGIRTVLRAGAEHLTDRQQQRLRRAIERWCLIFCVRGWPDQPAGLRV